MQEKFHHKNFENIPVFRHSKKTGFVAVRVESELEKQLKEEASRLGLDFAEYLRKKLKSEVS